MWEDPVALWRRLSLGREEYLQRLLTTLICGGEAPRWNSPVPPSAPGRRFLYRLDELAHGTTTQPPDTPARFVDEYLLPKVEESARNGWPDWAVLWPDRVWLIELKTERGSHRDQQLPYYARLAARAHPGLQTDLTYITGPMVELAPPVQPGQRYRHLQWADVAKLVEEAWKDNAELRVAAYVETVRTVIDNLAVLRPLEQRDALLGQRLPEGPGTPAGADLLELARATAADGAQRAVGAASPTELEELRDLARERVDDLAPDDPARFILPWLWRATRSGGQALTSEGREFGYELRFSRYKSL